MDCDVYKLYFKAQFVELTWKPNMDYVIKLVQIKRLPNSDTFVMPLACTFCTDTKIEQSEDATV